MDYQGGTDCRKGLRDWIRKEAYQEYYQSIVSDNVIKSKGGGEVDSLGKS